VEFILKDYYLLCTCFMVVVLLRNLGLLLLLLQYLGCYFTSGVMTKGSSSTIPLSADASLSSCPPNIISTYSFLIPLVFVL
jgi:hypothetical protein